MALLLFFARKSTSQGPRWRRACPRPLPSGSGEPDQPLDAGLRRWRRGPSAILQGRRRKRRRTGEASTGRPEQGQQRQGEERRRPNHPGECTIKTANGFIHLLYPTGKQFCKLAKKQMNEANNLFEDVVKPRDLIVNQKATSLFVLVCYF